MWMQLLADFIKNSN